MEKEEVPPMSEIQEFFAGSTVFLTGATGFLGSLLLEKLLRACPQLKTIYVLVRTKKGKSNTHRLQELLDCAIFDGLKRKEPEVFKKVELMSGDCGVRNMGLSEQNLLKLKKEVDVVFHFAATLRFHQKLRIAAYTNVRSVVDLLSMAKEMEKLKVLVHCSTAYSFCTRKAIGEEIYETKITGDKLLQIVDALDDDDIDEMTPILLGETPNTYTFTKAIAERYIKDHRGDLPIAIVRPSAVVSTWKEPLRGWINNCNGPAGFIVGIMVGLLRVSRINPNKKGDMVPADYVVNAAISTAWEVGSVRTTNDFRVYNYVSDRKKLLTWDDYGQRAKDVSRKLNSGLAVWYPCFLTQPNETLYFLYVFLIQRIPAHIADFVLKMIGRKPMLVETNKRLEKFAKVCAFFGIHEWEFSDDNTKALWTKLNPVDKKLFEFTMTEFDWDEFLPYHFRGVRVYLIKDPMSTVPDGIARFRKLKVAHYATVGVLLFALLGVLFVVSRFLLSFL